ncbi:DUF5134 domain-containing protein [Kitasatospora sp. NBC_01287]|uniref:DUF5134 domain-containing protein n=1 Tax=Kitasatospora sp. NBC_01287 TaxID=2903573 RepID=UPI00224DA81E|nr:DUF5134 domain-containing protein [Kitasatospora sp. NBC_01287]MCX4750669.1 DUF5134 domain-containing protein [Kitasatospora sp. NBC_01287]
MHGPAVLSWLLVVLTTATGLLCLLRLRRPGTGTRHPAGLLRDGAHPGSRESDAAEAAMALGTAAMVLLGDRLPAPLWVGLFGLLGAASLCAAAGPRASGRRAHRLHHVMGAGAMAYMALAMGQGARAEHPGMAMPMGLPVVTGLLLLYFGGYTLWSGSRLLSVAAHPGGPVAGTAGGTDPAGTGAGAGPEGGLLGGALPQACRLAMGVGMFAMLLVL